MTKKRVVWIVAVLIVFVGGLIVGCSPRRGEYNRPGFVKVTSQPFCPKTTLKGVGNKFIALPYSVDECRTITFTNRASSNVFVWSLELIGSTFVEDRLIINEIGVGTWSKRWPAATEYLQVESKGAWEFHLD